MKKNLIDKVKEPVRIRSKELKDGSKSLYLDVYLDGVRRYEFLKLYLIPEKCREDKVSNLRTLNLANAIKAKRIVEIQNRKYDFSNSDLNSSADLLEYMRIRAKKAQKHGTSTTNITECSIRMLKMYRKSENIPFSIVDKKFLVGYVEFLKKVKSKHGKPLSKYTILNYYRALTAALKTAVLDEIISINPATKLRVEEKPEQGNSSRCYLTMEEIRKLYQTECSISYVKQIFLFACMCGLRYSDIVSLRWGNIIHLQDNRTIIRIFQIKTGKELVIPLSKEAIALLPKGEYNPEGPIFGEKFSVPFVEKKLREWVADAQIRKYITFHVRRHN